MCFKNLLRPKRQSSGLEVIFLLAINEVYVFKFTIEEHFESNWSLLNLVPRVFLRHTLITKPNEHPGTLR